MAFKMAFWPRRLPPTLVLLAGLLVSTLAWSGPDPGAAEPAHPAAAARPQGLFDLYAENRTLGRPNYITADLVLLGYSLIRRASLIDLEDGTLRPALADFLTALRARLKPADDPITQANRRWLALLGALLAGDPAGLEPPAAAEYDLVRRAGDLADSPLWGRPIDYSQFRPRGRYAADAALGDYFRALRYAGAIPFLVQPSPATGTTPEGAAAMTAQALQIARLIAADPDLAAQRQRLDDRLAWQFGPPEDLTDADLLAVAGEAATPADLGPRLLARARAEHRQPRILDAVIDRGRLAPGQTAADALTGWRLLPARQQPVAAAFQRLVYDGTGDYQGPAGAHSFGLGRIDGRLVKAYPRLDEVLALLGSTAAAHALETAHETAFAGYPEARTAAAGRLDAAAGLAAAELAVIRAGLRDQDSAERRTALKAFWTWQRYLEVLYAKQSNTLVGKGLVIEAERPGATLEPATGLYRALGEVARLQSSHTGDPRWETLAAILGRLAAASRGAEQGAAPDRETERLLNRLDRDLMALAGQGDTPIVVDVHTHAAEGQVVEEGVGWAEPVEQGQARGARLTHHEFKQPMDRRLTDSEWRERLAGGVAGPP